MPILDPGPLRVERLPDGRRRLLRALRYKVDGVKEPIVVPGDEDDDEDESFVTDFSSDPVGLLDWSKTDVAGVVHDYLYQNPGKVKGVTTRLQEDWIWFKIARSGKWRCSPFTACLGLLGMVLFGWLFRKNDGSNIFLKVLRGLGWLAVAGILLGLLLLGIQEVFEFAIQIYSRIAGLEKPPKLGIKAGVIVVVGIRLVAALVRHYQRKRLDELDTSTAG